MLDFKGTGRFTVDRRLGQGGMGVVYLAHDRERGGDVALKTLTRLDAAGIASLKNEFRVLAGVTHPNLVALHELVSEGGQWFFTMEVVKGQDFVTYVRLGAEQAPGAWSNRTTVQVSTAHADAATLEVESDQTPPPTARVSPSVLHDIDRLRGALRQLAEGIGAIHAAGKLHRDLKPSNVLVTPAGRVVILDFGLAMVYGQHHPTEPASSPRLIVGTPAYMAPEQAMHDAAQPASDWYAFGLMLYEALTGQLPFGGDTRQILLAKRIAEPAPPSTMVPGIPEDLNRLCADCLRREPERRPTGLEVLRRLGVEAPVSARAALSEPRREQGPLLIGRDEHLVELRRALSVVRQGRPVTVYVSGKSGMGKTALIDHFLAEIRRGDAMVLTGRCYERESVPYKAWDSLIDALSRHLGSLPPEDAARSIPPNISDLARVFPVLQGAIGGSGGEPASPGAGPGEDQLETRRRAFGALKELVRLVPAGRPLVLCIDDLQWGDVDSAKLMESLLSPPDAPPLLLLCSCRSEEVEESEFFQEIESATPALAPARERGAPSPSPSLEADPLEMGEVRTIQMDRLSPEHSTRLALALLDGAAPSAPALAEAIARESEGSPFFIAELVRHGGALGGVSLESVLQDRIRGLPEDARRLLEVLAVAARPIEQGMAATAAGLSFGETFALDVLRAANLVRTRGAKARDLVEPYHDRVRETVTAGLDAARLRECHEQLAGTLEAAGCADPEVLAAHFEGAGQLGRTRHYAILAAEKASAALAFDRAARLYRLALSTWSRKAGQTDRPPPLDDSPALALQRSLAQALVNAGRGAEAAPVFLAAALRAGEAEALELRRLAAEQFMVCGHFDRGAQVLRAVLPSVDLQYPETPIGATLTLLARLTRLRLRGTQFEERPARDVPAAKLSRIDACYSAGKGLILVDPVRGLGFFAQHLLLSLEAGEPGRVCVGLAFYGANLCVGGGPVYPKAKKILDQALALAERLDDPYLRGVAGTCAAASQMCLGRWEATVEQAAESGEILRRGCSGVAWEIECGVVFSEVSLLWMGRLNELVGFVRTHARQALDRGDLFAATYARMHTWYSPIAADDPARASAEMRDAIGRWSQGGFHIMHFWALYGETQYELYAGDAAAASARITGAWADLERSNILRVQFHRVFMVLLRGSTAVAAACARRSDQKRLLQAAERDARSLDAEGMHYARPAASLLRAGIHAASGRRRDALTQLDGAIAGFDGADMALHAACARRRRGEIVGGDEGKALIAAADAYMTGQSIKNPARWTRIYAPGFDRD